MVEQPVGLGDLVQAGAAVTRLEALTRGFGQTGDTVSLLIQSVTWTSIGIFRARIADAGTFEVDPEEQASPPMPPASPPPPNRHERRAALARARKSR